MEAVQDCAGVGPLGASAYARHRPEETLLYQVIDENYADFIARLDAQGRSLPKFVRQECEPACNSDQVRGEIGVQN
jgi:hypothetical protein